jgi:Fe-S-cluster containining protein
MDKSAKQLGRRMLSVYRQLDPKLEEAATNANVTCKKGCASCCYLQIYVSLPEAVAMAEQIAKDPQYMAEVLKRCYEQLPKLNPDNALHFKQMLPCVLLDTETKTCTSYDSRPTACRHHYVVSPAENCSPLADNVEIERLNLEKVDAFVLGEALRVLKQHNLPALLAPIPVALLWAFRLLVEGEDKFIDTLSSKEDFGLMDIRRWTTQALAAVEATTPMAETPVESVTTEGSNG